MDESSLGALIMIFGASLPCGSLGYLIAVKQIRGLIAGWDESKISSPEAFARLIGYSLMLLAIGIAILAIFVWRKAIHEDTLVILLLIISALPIAAGIYGNIKYGIRGS